MNTHTVYSALYNIRAVQNFRAHSILNRFISTQFIIANALNQTNILLHYLMRNFINVGRVDRKLDQSKEYENVIDSKNVNNFFLSIVNVL